MKIIERFKWSCCCLLWEVLLLLKGTWISLHPKSYMYLSINLILLDLWQACTITMGIFFACVQGNVHGRMQDNHTLSDWFGHLCCFSDLISVFLPQMKRLPPKILARWTTIILNLTLMILIKLISINQKGLLVLYPDYMSFSSNVTIKL